MADIALRPSYWASVSGGKDSLYMLKLILSNPKKYPLDGVVHFELEIDYPFIKDVIDYMEKECKKHGIKFLRIKPRKTWQELYDKWGFLTTIRRWCNNLKLDAKRQLEEFLNGGGMTTVSYIGYCADEEKRFSKRAALGRERYPLVEEGIKEETILDWAKSVPIFNDYYKYNARCGCMWCPMQSMRDSAYLAVFYPAEYKRMMELAKSTEKERGERYGKPVSVWNGNSKYNTEYREKIVREKYIPMLMKEMEEHTNDYA